MGLQSSTCSCLPFPKKTDDESTPAPPDTPTPVPAQLTAQPSEANIINNLITDQANEAINALNLCKDKGIPIVVKIESILNVSFLDALSDSNPYVCVQIDNERKFTKPAQQNSDPEWHQNLLFMAPIEFMNNCVSTGKLCVTFKLIQHSELMVSYMSNNTEVLVDMSLHKGSYTNTGTAGNELPEKSTKLYEKSTYDQLSGCDVVVKSPVMDFFDTTAETKTLNPYPTNVLNTQISKSSTFLERRPTDLRRAKTYDSPDHEYGMDAYDNCVAECKLEIELEKDLSLYKQTRSAKLKSGEDKTCGVGEIRYQIFLNAVQVYQQTCTK